jgi:hypothetical protein
MSFVHGSFNEETQQVLADDKAGQPANTKKAYGVKVKEFLAFCEEIFTSNDPALPSTIVTEEKLFAFLFYQSRRPVRKQGKKRQSVFDKKDYSKYRQDPSLIATKPVGHSCISQYYWELWSCTRFRWTMEPIMQLRKCFDQIG